ncbi:MAG: hypothetical protein ABIF10_03980 [Candidatus Woesearchaeota archaeon]
MATERKVNIFLKDRIHTEAKIASVLNKETLNNFLARAIRESVEKDKALLQDLLK